MPVNVGNIDRVLRFVLGLVLLAAPFAISSEIWSNSIYFYGAIVVGIVMLATSAMKFCPLYRLIGMQTCRI